MIDLHIHTDASSDGQHFPEEIFRLAVRKNLRALAFADHNTMANVTEGLRLAAETGIEFLPAMELNTFYGGLDLHLLAFHLDPDSPEVEKWLRAIQRQKELQARRRRERLNELGFLFSREDLERFATGRLPTGKTFLQAILSRPENLGDPRLRPYIDGDRSASPYVSFYRDYLRGGKPAAVPIPELSTPPAIRRIRELGGIPVLAHPSDTAKEILLFLIREGLEGLEVYSPYHSPAEEDSFRALAEAHSLLITAGSDFHGPEVKPGVELGGVRGNSYDLFQKLAERRKGKR